MNGLASFLNTINEIIKPVYEFIVWMFPIKISRLTDGDKGVILSFGKVRRKNAERGPGISIYFMFEEMFTSQSIGCYIDCSEQALVVKDGTVMLANGGVVYNIINVKEAILLTENLKELVEGYCMNEIRDYAKTKTQQELMDSDKLTNDLAIRVNRKIKKHGVKVEKFIITDLRPHNFALISEAIKTLKFYQEVI